MGISFAHLATGELLGSTDNFGQHSHANILRYNILQNTFTCFLPTKVKKGFN